MTASGLRGVHRLVPPRSTTSRTSARPREPAPDPRHLHVGATRDAETPGGVAEALAARTAALEAREPDPLTGAAAMLAVGERLRPAGEIGQSAGCGLLAVLRPPRCHPCLRTFPSRPSAGNLHGTSTGSPAARCPPRSTATPSALASSSACATCCGRRDQLPPAASARCSPELAPPALQIFCPPRQMRMRSWWWFFRHPNRPTS